MISAFMEHHLNQQLISLLNVLQKRFGNIPGVTDKNYITNSYHVHVTEKINAFDKLEIRITVPGSYLRVELSVMLKFLICRIIFDAVLKVMQYIYDNIMYAELNTKSDYCQECGYTWTRFKL